MSYSDLLKRDIAKMERLLEINSLDYERRSIITNTLCYYRQTLRNEHKIKKSKVNAGLCPQDFYDSFLTDGNLNRNY